MLNKFRLARPRELIVLLLLLIGEGEQVSQIARTLMMPTETALSRLRLGRKHLPHGLNRWCRLQ
ncbi:hypothetical protein WMF11_22545 [Sorangium sp. So ce295]|uniref:hypothetical protein n=1 Tax=Sorangium sp. So ce295 TaxID=3133295 RepID=UPI003F5FC244